MCYGCKHDSGLSSSRGFEPTQTIHSSTPSPTSRAISNTADYSILIITPPLYSLKEGLHVRNVNIKYEAYLSKCQLSHRSGVFLFFYYDLMRSYRTITYTNNNFITLALAVITVSAQCLTYTNSSDKAPGEVRFSNLSFASFYVNIVFSIMNSS